MNRMTNCFRALAVAATLSLGMLAGCGSEEEPKVEQCQTEEVACGEKCCAANERCDAASSTCKPAEQTECAAQ